MLVNMVSENETFKERACGYCGNSAGQGCKRWKFFFSYNRSAYLCAACLTTHFDNTAKAVEWLEQNAQYHPVTGKLIGFKNEVKKIE